METWSRYGSEGDEYKAPSRSWHLARQAVVIRPETGYLRHGPAQEPLLMLKYSRKKLSEFNF